MMVAVIASRAATPWRCLARSASRSSMVRALDEMRCDAADEARSFTQQSAVRTGEAPPLCPAPRHPKHLQAAWRLATTWRLMSVSSGSSHHPSQPQQEPPPPLATDGGPHRT